MSYLSNFTNAELNVFLSEAQTAYNKLMTGTQVVSISRAGRTVNFKASNRNELLAYINDLHAAINSTTTRTAGRVYF